MSTSAAFSRTTFVATPGGEEAYILALEPGTGACASVPWVYRLVAMD